MMMMKILMGLLRIRICSMGWNMTRKWMFKRGKLEIGRVLGSMRRFMSIPKLVSLLNLPCTLLTPVSSTLNLINLYLSLPSHWAPSITTHLSKLPSLPSIHTLQIIPTWWGMEAERPSTTLLPKESPQNLLFSINLRTELKLSRTWASLASPHILHSTRTIETKGICLNPNLFPPPISNAFHKISPNLTCWHQEFKSENKCIVLRSCSENSTIRWMMRSSWILR